MKANLRCPECGKIFSSWKEQQDCPNCGTPLEFVYDYGSLSDKKDLLGNQRDIWRFFPLLPVSNSPFISLGEGFTPLRKARGLMNGWELSVPLYVKNESLNPTGSFLDRGASVAVSRAKELHKDSIICGTRGDLGASISAYSARAGMECEIFVPKRLEMEKLYQMTLFGAQVNLVESYEKAVERVENSPFAFTLTVNNPHFLEGLKTTAFEIFDQLEELPDKLAVGVGTGSYISMIWKGFKELKKLGWIKQDLPSLIGIQTEAVDPLVKAFSSNSDHIPKSKQGETIAKDLAFYTPPRGNVALKAIKESRGTLISVSEQEILQGMEVLAKKEGILTEPAGGVTVAGVKKLIEQGIICSTDKTVMIITGSGLKDQQTIQTLVKKVDKGDEITSLMRKEKSINRIGKTKYLILRILSKGKDYGYHIRKVLEQKFGTSVSLPTVYQHLKELTDLGLLTKVSSQNGREKKFYFLSERGKSLLE